MTAICQFSIPGDPVAKGRARFTVRGGFARSYTPKKTRAYEEAVSEVAFDAMNGDEPTEAAVKLCLDIWLPIPKRWRKRDKELAAVGQILPTSKPDTTNVAKAIEDALNGVVWKDDSQVVSIEAHKKYSINPRVDVLVMGAGA